MGFGIAALHRWDLGSRIPTVRRAGGRGWCGAGHGAVAAPQFGTEVPIGGVSFLRCSRLGSGGGAGGAAGTNGGGAGRAVCAVGFGVRRHRYGGAALEEGRKNGEGDGEKWERERKERGGGEEEEGEGGRKNRGKKGGGRKIGKKKNGEKIGKKGEKNKNKIKGKKKPEKIEENN